MIKFRALTLATAAMLALAGVPSAEVCSSWDSEITGPFDSDPQAMCICQVQPDYNHTLYILDWQCLTDAQHQVDCGTKSCTDSTMQDEYSLLCDTQWCGTNQHYEWYGAEEHCDICL